MSSSHSPSRLQGLVLCAVLFASPLQADTLFFADGPQSDGEAAGLYRFDTVSGELQRLSTAPLELHALAADADGLLYGVVGNSGPLVTINPFSGQVLATIGPVNTGGGPLTITDMTFSGGVLYGWNKDSSDLVTIDTATGTATSLGGALGRLGIAADSAGNFYAASDTSNLYTLDESNGTTAAQGTITGMGYSTVRALAFDSADTLYAINFSRCCSFNSALYTLDVTTQVASLVRNLPAGVVALAVVAEYPDSDSDGLPDLYESLTGLDSAAGDPDGDGLTTLEEFTAGSDPTAADTDNDGLDDGTEVNDLGTDPLNDDTDADGVQDGGEVAIGLDPADGGDTRPGLTTLTDGSEAVWAPEATEDGAGNVHLIWMQNNGIRPNNGGSNPVIYYAMFDADGQTLIAPTALTTGARADSRPTVAANAAGDVFVGWHSSSDSMVYFMRLDPSAAPQDGTASDVGTLAAVAETAIADGQHARIAAQGNTVHLVIPDSANNDTGGQLEYYQLDADGNITAGPVLLDEDTYRNSVDIAIDGNGDVHIAWIAGSSGNSSTVMYAMLAGADGSLLIAPTPLTGADGFTRMHTNILAGSDGKLYLVWADKSLSGNNDSETGHEIAFASLDPSAAAQDGSASSAGELLVTGPLAVTGNDGIKSSYPYAAFAANGNIQISYKDLVGDDYSWGNPQRQFVTTVAPDGSSVTPPTALSLASGGGIGFSYAPIAGGRVWWADGADATLLPRLSSASAPASGPEGPRGALNMRTNIGTLLLAQAISLQDLPAAAAADAPAGVKFPDGLLRVVIDGVPVGGDVVVTLTLAGAADANGTYYKWDANNGWYDIPYVMSGDNEIQLILTDGGTGDADGRANGQIADPGGLGVTGVTSTATGSGGGCTLNPGAPFDPTLPLLVLLALLGLAWQRRRHTVQGRN